MDCSRGPLLWKVYSLLSRQTLRDDSIPHQVKFFSRGTKTVVTCNCKATVGTHEKAGKIIYEDFGFVKDLVEAREKYNDPSNHNGVFVDEDRATW